jgi:hypothetical protein
VKKLFSLLGKVLGLPKDWAGFAGMSASNKQHGKTGAALAGVMGVLAKKTAHWTAF